MLRRLTPRVQRLGRRLLWAHPRLYRWFGILRGRGDCIENLCDVWVGGYPRSANSFTTAALRLGNPSLLVATHWHIPAFIINALDAKKPGILLIRKPLDAVASWTIFWEGRRKLEDALDYYLDFHRTLLDCRKELFVASFDEAVGDFSKLMERFNQTFGTNYVALPKDNSSRCLSYLEDWFRESDGSLNESKVPRPSSQRAVTKASLLEEIANSPHLTKKLAMADDLYQKFCRTREELCPCNSNATPALRLSGV